MRDPYPLHAHALSSNSAQARVRNLFYLLKAERLCEDRWRLPGGALLYGNLDDFVHRVDRVKQIEEWAIERQAAELGEDELRIDVTYNGVGWAASITPLLTNSFKYESGTKPTEAMARIEVLIAYFNDEMADSQT